MRVLLVNPPIYDFAAYDLWAKPAGLLKIGKVLKENQIDVHLFDFMDRFNPVYSEFSGKNREFNTGKFYNEVVEKPEILKDVPKRYKRYGLPNYLFVKKLKELNPDIIILTSVMTYWYLGVKEVIDTVRKYTNAKILLGGIYATLMPEHAKEVLKPDFISIGNDTVFFKEFFNVNITIEEILHVLPDYSFYPEPKVAVINTTYGCPYRCSYCASFILQPKFIRIKVDWEEYLRELYIMGVEDIAFLDDALIMDKKHFLEFCEIAGDFDFNFHIPNGVHVNKIDEEIAEAFKRINVKTIRLSVESIDPKEMKRNSNKTGREEFLKSVKILRSKGINHIGAYILAGLPNQDLEGVLKTIEFVKQNGIRPYISEYAPVPGTIEFKINKYLKKLDPLLHNNSVYSGMFTLGWDKLQFIKDFSRREDVVVL